MELHGHGEVVRGLEERDVVFRPIPPAVHKALNVPGVYTLYAIPAQEALDDIQHWDDVPVLLDLHISLLLTQSSADLPGLTEILHGK